MWKRDDTTKPGAGMRVHHRIFESSTRSWEDLCKETEGFATTKGRENVINISVGASGGDDLSGRGGNGVLIVWYWE